MFKTLFKAILDRGSSHYGDSIGLSPIALAVPKRKENYDRLSAQVNSKFWMKECTVHPSQIACLNYALWTNSLGCWQDFD